MPMITNFVYCEQVESINQKPAIIGPLNFLNPKFIPGMFSFTVSFGVIGMDTERENTLKLMFLDPNDIEVAGTEVLNIPRSLNPNEGKIPMEVRGFIANMEFKNVIFRSAGLYNTEIILNGESIGRSPIMVKGVEVE
ncbi:DUF6941 family protein [Bacillus sp. CH_442]|uniref:DUF6941 family protein n=1 Tax=Bacillus sp. CH_442 TaxID=2978217 RepID=UPI0030FCC87E|nr:hypothetical protein [Bacillus thuringiensis]